MHQSDLDRKFEGRLGVTLVVPSRVRHIVPIMPSKLRWNVP